MPVTAPPPVNAPPAAPEVADQQGSISRYLANQQGGPGGQAVGGNPMALVEQKLSQVAKSLMDVAKVLGASKPALMPILQKMLQAGSMLQSEVQKDKSGPQPNQGAPQSSQPPEPDSDEEGGGTPPIG